MLLSVIPMETWPQQKACFELQQVHNRFGTRLLGCVNFSENCTETRSTDKQQATSRPY